MLWQPIRGLNYIVQLIANKCRRRRHGHLHIMVILIILTSANKAQPHPRETTRVFSQDKVSSLTLHLVLPQDNLSYNHSQSELFSSPNLFSLQFRFPPRNNSSLNLTVLENRTIVKYYALTDMDNNQVEQAMQQVQQLQGHVNTMWKAFDQIQETIYNIQDMFTATPGASPEGDSKASDKGHEKANDKGHEKAKDKGHEMANDKGHEKKPEKIEWDNHQQEGQTRRRPKCIFCGQRTHFSCDCDVEVTLKERLHKADKDLCRKCLALKGYGTHQCRTKKPCRFCHSNGHHAAFCPKKCGQKSTSGH
uniref:CCHC-type domain-containing protein n=1 Tax=Caenorhabditis japonica TaxID=281687 RepID=A0A8R1HW81_CAEJA